ncbi:MAG: hypothetical protein U0V03_02795 [Bacteroidia bacterium]
MQKGFGFDANLKAQLSAKYSEYGSVLSNAFIYADSLLATTKGRYYCRIWYSVVTLERFKTFNEY